MGNSIILIGPSCAGKSTIGALLGKQLKWPVVELDELRWNYYAEIGYDAEYAKTIRNEQGFEALAAYWKPFDIHGLERVLTDYPDNHVLSLGAGISIYDDEERMQRARKALESFGRVVLLLPSPNQEECINILEQRLREKLPNPSSGLLAVNRSFVGHPSNAELAKITIYSAEQTPEKTCETIIQALNLP